MSVLNENRGQAGSACALRTCKCRSHVFTQVRDRGRGSGASNHKTDISESLGEVGQRNGYSFLPVSLTRLNAIFPRVLPAEDIW